VFIIYRWTEISRVRELQFLYPLRNEARSSAGVEIEARETKDRKFLKRVFVFGGVLIIWQGVWIPTDHFNTEKKLAESQKSSFLSAYENGWVDQCEALFGRLGGIDNYAYGKGIAITYPQCLSLKTNSAADFAFNEQIGGYIRDASDYEMKESGRYQANRDLLVKMFSMSPYWCYGADCLAGSDFGVDRPKE
jgi:hypothetical protein